MTHTMLSVLTVGIDILETPRQINYKTALPLCWHKITV